MLMLSFHSKGYDVKNPTFYLQKRELYLCFSSVKHGLTERIVTIETKQTTQVITNILIYNFIEEHHVSSSNPKDLSSSPLLVTNGIYNTQSNDGY